MEYGAEGNINRPVIPVPVPMPEYNELIEAAIVARLKPGYIANIQEEGRDEPTDDADILTFIKDMLIDCEALVAGGFLLGTIHNYDRRDNINYQDPKLDMDFYVPCRNLVKFNKVFAKLIDAHSVSQHNATFYCRSFLRRNGIRSVQTFFGPEINDDRASPLIDIMAVRNARSPLDVVQNFDLTFCQIWYDGKNVSATHPQDVRTKNGTLQGDYVKLLVEEHNLFLVRRIRKYQRRGYKIKYDTSVFNTMPEITINTYTYCPKEEKDEDFYNRWITRFVLHSLLYNHYAITKGYIDTKHDRLNQNNRGIAHQSIHMNNGYRLITDKRAPIDTMENINVGDGYDTDDYDITTPAKFYPELNRMAVNLPAGIQQAWIAQPDDLKFRKVLQILLTNYYSTDPNKSPIGNRIYNTIEFMRAYPPPHIPPPVFEESIRQRVLSEIYDTFEHSRVIPYTNALKVKTQRLGTDAITLDDNVQVYDIHLHTLDDAVGVAGLQSHLDTLIGQHDKTNLPCYLAGCQMVLTLDEIRAMVDETYYRRFTEPVALPLPPPDALLGELPTGELGPDGNPITVELGTILRNAASTTDGWGNIYHWVMCPFCLGYIGRQAGCTYVMHPNPGTLPGSFSPFCKEQNIIKEVRDKYTDAGYNRLEVCIECGRACSHHQHLDFNDPPGYAPQRLTANGGPNYSTCAGGGRREALARMIAVRKTVQENPEMEPVALRTLAGLAAEAGASNEVFLTQADGILAKAAADRVNTNLNAPAQGGYVGAVCPHGYENYREKIPNTRKRSQKKTKGTRKSRTNQ
jgi:hypothetical protein